MAKTAINMKKTLFNSKLHINLWDKLVKIYIWSIALCGAATSESSETWCWRSLEKFR
jgi:hypothetical protein